jgi:hypothetical protein
MLLGIQIYTWEIRSTGSTACSGHDGKQLAMHMAMHSYYLQKDGQWIDSGKWSLSKS